jgi:hypothetical protein
MWRLGAAPAMSVAAAATHGMIFSVHASIWRFSGDPDALLRSYEAMVAEIPAENMRLHLCLRADDGIVLVDTCPSKEVFDTFFAGEGFRSLRERHGLPEPTSLDDLAVHAAFIDGKRL